jgi:magnesium chelatase family protein
MHRPAVPPTERAFQPGTASATMRANVLEARQRQRARFDGQATKVNARMGPRMVRKHCPLDDAGEMILKQAMTELGLSARAHDKVLRVARTIADVENSDRIKPEHLSEAVNYRQLDRQR